MSPEAYTRATVRRGQGAPTSSSSSSSSRCWRAWFRRAKVCEAYVEAEDASNSGCRYPSGEGKSAFAYRIPLVTALLLPGRTSTAPGQVYWRPPRLPIQDIRVRATMPKELIPGLRVGSELIVLEHTSLDTLQRRLGAGSMSETGEAGSFLQWLCLYGRSEQGRWVLWLESGEMGAGTVEGFHLVSVPATGRIDP